MLEDTNAGNSPEVSKVNEYDSDKSADARKMLKKLMFLYLANLNGWHIQKISSNKFQMTKMWNDVHVSKEKV